MIDKTFDKAVGSHLGQQRSPVESRHEPDQAILNCHRIDAGLAALVHPQSRYLLLFGLPKQTSVHALLATLNANFAVDSIEACLTGRLRIDGSVIIAFVDANSADAAHRTFVEQHPGARKPVFVTPQAVLESHGQRQSLSFLGGPLVFAFMGANVTIEHVYYLLASFGALSLFRPDSRLVFGNGVWRSAFVVQWLNAQHAENASNWAMRDNGSACKISVTPYLQQQQSQASTTSTAFDSSTPFSHSTSAVLDSSTEQVNNGLDETTFDLDIHTFISAICDSPTVATFHSDIRDGTSGTADSNNHGVEACQSSTDSTSDSGCEVSQDDASSTTGSSVSVARTSASTAGDLSRASSIKTSTTSTEPSTAPSSLSSSPISTRQSKSSVKVEVRKESAPAPVKLNKAAAEPTKNFGIYREDKVPAVNVINMDRLRFGKEKRTTLMIKNIPNRMSSEDLIKFIDDSLDRRAFSFLYLRIDFKTRNNVGYAFVDFNTPKDVHAFCQARLGTRYDMYGSDKLVAACFAKVQGRAMLVKHFRNSAIMEENDAFRPKLFDAQGREEAWPACNDAAQKARSNVNKTKVGLFAPQRNVIFKTAKLGAGNTQSRSRF